MSDYEKDDDIYYEFEKKKSKALPIVIVLFVLSVFSLFFIATKTDLLDGFLESKDENVAIDNKSEIAMDKDFATGLRLASLERYDEAINHFEKVKFNKLNEDDQQLVLMTYLYSGNEQKALDINKKIDEEIIKTLVKNNDLEKLRELETDSKLIQFEIAVLDNDFEKIIELKDTPRLEKDSRRANAIANAYYQTDQIEEAINFTAMMASSGINMWEEGKVIIDNQPISNNNNNEGEKTSLPRVIIFALFIIFIGFVIYFIFINKDNIKRELKARREKKRQLKIDKLKKKAVNNKKEIDNEDDEKVEYVEYIEYEDGTVEERKISHDTEENSKEDDKYSYYYDE